MYFTLEQSVLTQCTSSNDSPEEHLAEPAAQKFGRHPGPHGICISNRRLLAYNNQHLGANVAGYFTSAVLKYWLPLQSIVLMY
jgi:hypothetical protein